MTVGDGGKFHPAQRGRVSQEILPLESETVPALIAYPPLAEPLARGVVIIQYRAEHARIMPVFGKAAVEVSPRLAHLSARTGADANPRHAGLGTPLQSRTARSGPLALNRHPLRPAQWP